MKKALLFLFTICLGLMVQAQTSNELGNSANVEKPTDLLDEPVRINPITPQPESAAVYFTENFSAGITSWTNAGFDGAGNTMAAALWEYRGLLTTPANTVGSRGAWAGTQIVIASPTAINGFVIFDSDFLDDAGSQTGAGTGVAPAPHVGTLTSPKIDLSSATGAVQVDFYHFMRTFFGQSWVTFSNNGGLTWPDSALLSLPATNGSTDNAVHEVMILPASYAGKADVRMKLVFDGRPGNANGSGYYFAQIDDITIQDAPANDLALGNVSNSATTGILYLDGSVSPIDILDDLSADRYGRVPTNQVRGIHFDGSLINIGSQAAQDAQLQVTLTDAGGTQVYQDASTATTLAARASRVDTASTNFVPAPMGELYTMAWAAQSVSTDATPQNNLDTLVMEVTDASSGSATYALDFTRAWNDAEFAFLGTNSFTNGEDGFRMASRYSIINQDVLQSVFIRLSTLSRVGGIMKVIVFDTTGSQADIATYESNAIRLMESDFVVLTAADTASNGITIDIPATLLGFPQDRTLMPGAYYIAVELTSSGGTNTIRIPSDESVSQHGWASLIFIDGDRWYTNGNAFVIRPNLQNWAVGVEDLDNNGFIVKQNQPNPFNGSTRIDVQIDFGGDLQLDVTNTLGQMVYSKALTSANAGQHTFNVDASSLQAGVYMYTISLNGKSVTKRMIVE